MQQSTFAIFATTLSYGWRNTRKLFMEFRLKESRHLSILVNIVKQHSPICGISTSTWPGAIKTKPKSTSAISATILSYGWTNTRKSFMGFKNSIFVTLVGKSSNTRRCYGITRETCMKLQMINVISVVRFVRINQPSRSTLNIIILDFLFLPSLRTHISKNLKFRTQ